MMGTLNASMHPYKRHLYNSQNIHYDSNAGSSNNSNVSLDLDILNNDTAVLNNNESFNKSEDFNESYQDSVKPPQQVGRQRSATTTPNSNESSYISLSSDQLKNASRQQRTRSVDLSHMYLLNNSNDTQLTSTNESVADLSHKMITRYLGTDNNTSLMPRLKTIEMYRENVKKSKDPKLLFEYAQYMLQTALTIDTTNPTLNSSNNNDSNQNLQNVNDPSSQDLKKQFLKDALHYLKKLSTKGYSDAQYLLADAYSSGVFGKIENRESFILFQAAAKHGHVESAYRTAHCYEEGLGTTRDSRKALNFLKFAASRNHPSAMYKLGLYSFNSRMGLPNDVNTKQNGIKWLSRASARANELTCAAPYELAKIYENGFLDIIIPDEKYAMELYIQAATLGHTQSSTILGQLYETGNSVVEQDISLSVHYYTQAALQNDPVAMLGLCAWYLLGAEPVFKRDETEAFQWVLKAANCGLPKAQFTLGYFYENGKGCEVNNTLAWKWYEKAAKKNDQRAINKINKRDNIDSTKSTPNKKKRHEKSKSINTLNLFAINNSSGMDYENSNTNQDNQQKKEQIEMDNDYLNVQPMETPKYFNNPTFNKSPDTNTNQSASNFKILKESSDNTLNLASNPSLSGPQFNQTNENAIISDKGGKKSKDKSKKNCIVM